MFVMRHTHRVQQRWLPFDSAETCQRANDQYDGTGADQYIRCRCGEINIQFQIFMQFHLHPNTGAQYTQSRSLKTKKITDHISMSSKI